MSINGTEGRLEAVETSSGPNKETGSDKINIFSKDGKVTTHEVIRPSGTHGGADDIMRDMLFRPGKADNDELGQMAGIDAGINSIMIGICANMSIKDKKVHVIKDELKY